MEQSDRSSDSGEYDEHIEALAPDEDLFDTGFTFRLGESVCAPIILNPFPLL